MDEVLLVQPNRLPYHLNTIETCNFLDVFLGLNCVRFKPFRNLIFLQNCPHRVETAKLRVDVRPNNVLFKVLIRDTDHVLDPFLCFLDETTYGIVRARRSDWLRGFLLDCRYDFFPFDVYFATIRGGALRPSNGPAGIRAEPAILKVSIKYLQCEPFSYVPVLWTLFEEQVQLCDRHEAGAIAVNRIPDRRVDYIGSSIAVENSLTEVKRTNRLGEDFERPKIWMLTI